MIRELSEHEIRELHFELLMKDILSVAKKLPPFPDVVWRVMPLVQREASLKEIEGVIRCDQAIAAKILALSQSAFYRQKQAVRSLQQAILVLGSQRLIQALMTVCASRYFCGRAPGNQSAELALWHHSVATAIMSELLARHLQYKKVLTIYTAALLHDIGKTVLDFYSKIYIGSALHELAKDGGHFIEAERKGLGIDHQELGEIIARRWQFPPEIVVAIGHHHSPHRVTGEQDVAFVVYAANQMVLAMEEGKHHRGAFDPRQDSVFRELGISSDLVTRLQAEVTAAMQSVRDFLTAP